MKERILKIVVGTCITAFATAGYVLWHFDPVIACIIGIVGLVTLGKGIE